MIIHTDSSEDVHLTNFGCACAVKKRMPILALCCSVYYHSFDLLSNKLLLNPDLSPFFNSVDKDRSRQSLYALFSTLIENVCL